MSPTRAGSPRWDDALRALAAAIAALGAAGIAGAPLAALAEAQRHCNSAERLIEDLKREHEATFEGLVPTLPAQPADPSGPEVEGTTT